MFLFLSESESAFNTYFIFLLFKLSAASWRVLYFNHRLIHACTHLQEKLYRILCYFYCCCGLSLIFFFFFFLNVYCCRVCRATKPAAKQKKCRRKIFNNHPIMIISGLPFLKNNIFFLFSVLELETHSHDVNKT